MLHMQKEVANNKVTLVLLLMMTNNHYPFYCYYLSPHPCLYSSMMTSQGERGIYFFLIFVQVIIVWIDRIGRYDHDHYDGRYSDGDESRHCNHHFPVKDSALLKIKK